MCSVWRGRPVGVNTNTWRSIAKAAVGEREQLCRGEKKGGKNAATKQARQDWKVTQCLAAEIAIQWDPPADKEEKRATVILFELFQFCLPSLFKSLHF